MITIEQLLESVDLNFEPRWVTKDENGIISIWGSKPKLYRRQRYWASSEFNAAMESFGFLKLTEFANKDWTECIYEVPRKTDEYEQNLEKLRPADSDLVYRVKLPRETTGKIERLEPLDGLQHNWLDKINELVDAVNELKAKFAVPTLKPDCIAKTLSDLDMLKQVPVFPAMN